MKDIAIIGLFATLGILCIFALIKNEVTFHNRMKIAEAIYFYNLSYIRKGENPDADHYVSFDDMEDYVVTFERFWDWGYTRILPAEKFKLIRPFIKH